MALLFYFQNSFDLMQSLFVNVGKGTDAIIISASVAVQFVQERSELGYGVFTYSVIEAMNKFPNIKVSAFKKYISDQVLKLTNGLQKPTTQNETIVLIGKCGNLTATNARINTKRDKVNCLIRAFVA